MFSEQRERGQEEREELLMFTTFVISLESKSGCDFGFFFFSSPTNVRVFVCLAEDCLSSFLCHQCFTQG